MTAGEVSAREHLEGIFKEFKERYLSERKSDQDAFNDFKLGLDEKTKLQAAEYERRLTDYPSIRDFNELKEKVTIEFAAELGKGKVLPYVISVISVLISLVVGAVAVFKP